MTLFGQTKELLVKSFNNYKEYYDRKAAAVPLKLNDYCVILSPKLSNEHEKISNLQCKWNGLYRIEKIFSRSNYVVRKVNTNHTQIVHRVRLKPILPQYEVKDLTNIDSKQFIPDPLVPEALRQPELFDNSLEDMLYNPWDLNRVTKFETKIPQLKLNEQQNENTPERRTTESSVSNSATQLSTESSNSIFKTPESIGNDQVHSTPNSEISSPKSTNIRNIVPPSEPKAPLSNLSKIIAEKRAERAAQSSSSSSTVLTTAQNQFKQLYQYKFNNHHHKLQTQFHNMVVSGSRHNIFNLVKTFFLQILILFSLL